MAQNVNVDQDDEPDYEYPVHVNTFNIPNEKNLLNCHKAFEPSREILSLEKNRTIFPELFIKDRRLGTLQDLAIAALSKGHGVQWAPEGSIDPAIERIYSNALDVEMPLEKCYTVDSVQYWRRVVLAKSWKKSLALKDDTYPWKNHGVSLKYVERVEACPAEYWPEEEMKNLAQLVKGNILKMHIRNLQSLKDFSFKKFTESESVHTDMSDSTDISSLSPSEEEEEIVEEEEDEDEFRFPSPTTPMENEEEEGDGDGNAFEIIKKSKNILEIQKQREEHKKARLAKKAAIEAQRERREHRQAKLLAQKKLLKFHKKKRPKVKSVFTIPIEPEEVDEKEKIADKRNLEKLVHNMKKYDYPPEDCHHIDLSFIGYFDNMYSFTIEFLGPKVERNYHSRHLNFSYQDIQNLARGLSKLVNLKIFRLRNSRMDSTKFGILIDELKLQENIEILDFSFNNLDDDIGPMIHELLAVNTSLKALEFDGNKLSYSAMRELGDGIEEHEGEFEYLGLAKNPLGDDGLHALVTSIVATDQVSHLCLNGISCTEEGIICCIANKLLRKHEKLKQLDLVAVALGPESSAQILSALKVNKTILQLNVRGNDFDLDTEYDIETLLRRNQYIAENPFVGDDPKTSEEIDKYVNRVKNPILLHAYESIKKRDDCMKDHPDGAGFLKLSEDDEVPEDSVEEESCPGSICARFEVQDPYAIPTISYRLLGNESDDDDDDDEPIRLQMQPHHQIEFEPLKFNEELIKKHVNIPGPALRYNYFQTIKKRWGQL